MVEVAVLQQEHRTGNGAQHFGPGVGNRVVDLGRVINTSDLAVAERWQRCNRQVKLVGLRARACRQQKFDASKNPTLFREIMASPDRYTAAVVTLPVPQHLLLFLPLPQGHVWWRPMLLLNAPMYPS